MKVELTRLDFWKPLEVLNPEALKAFYKWIDSYKKKVNWEQMFNYGFPRYANQGWHNPKFHDLPVAMQFGIFLQFAFEINPHWVDSLDPRSLKDAHFVIQRFFSLENSPNIPDLKKRSLTKKIIHKVLNLFKCNNRKVIKLIREVGQAESRAVVESNSMVIAKRITKQVDGLVDTETENHKCTRRNFLFTPISLPDKEGYIWYSCDHPGCNKIAKFHPSKPF